MAKKTLDLYLDGRPVGQLHQNDHGYLSFDYAEQYRVKPVPTPLSLSMPITEEHHRGKKVSAFLEGLLPDNENTRKRWAEEYGVNWHNAFDLLEHVGRDAPGAVQILPEGSQSSDAAKRTGELHWLEEGDLSDLVRNLYHQSRDWNPGQYGGHWSLPGAQSKIALYRDPTDGRWGIPHDSTPTTHIIKPPMKDHPTHHINEALCMKAAKKLGLSVADVQLVNEPEVQAIVVERYDRRVHRGQMVRLHQEDMCQALSVPPGQKYQADGGPGIAEIGDLINRLPEKDYKYSREAFFKAVAYNVLMGGTDAHAKNYSLMLSGSRARLAPLYDLGSAAPQPQVEGLRSAMKVGGERYMSKIGPRQWEKAATRLKLDPDEAVSWVETMKTDLPEALESAIDELPPSAHHEAERMADQIDAHAQGRWKSSVDRNPGSMYPPGVVTPREQTPPHNAAANSAAKSPGGSADPASDYQGWSNQQNMPGRETPGMGGPGA